jgi:hypothetical protein
MIQILRILRNFSLIQIHGIIHRHIVGGGATGTVLWVSTAFAALDLT